MLRKLDGRQWKLDDLRKRFQGYTLTYSGKNSTGNLYFKKIIPLFALNANVSG
jgi:hypothetical protein